jgi:hypothetical protein
MPRRIESSCESAPLGQKSGTNRAAGSLATRETNMSGPQKGSKMREARETNVSGRQETSEMRGGAGNKHARGGVFCHHQERGRAAGQRGPGKAAEGGSGRKTSGSCGRARTPT